MDKITITPDYIRGLYIIKMFKIPKFRYEFDIGQEKYKKLICLIFNRLYNSIQERKFYILRPLDPKDDKKYIFSESIFYSDVWLVFEFAGKNPVLREYTTEQCKSKFTSYIDDRSDLVSIDELGTNSLIIWEYYMSNMPSEFFDDLIQYVIQYNREKYND